MYHRMCSVSNGLLCLLHVKGLFHVAILYDKEHLQGIVKNSMLNNHTIIQIDCLSNSNALCNWSNKENQMYLKVVQYKYKFIKRYERVNFDWT